MRLGGGQHKDGMWRRFFEGFEQRVKGRVGQHVDFVDDINLVAALVRGEGDLVAEAANLIDAAVGGGVDLNQVQGATFVDAHANGALVAGLTVLGIEAVHGLGKDARGARFARSARPGEQVGVANAPRAQRVEQRLGYVFLTDQLGKVTRTPSAVDRLRWHLPSGGQSSTETIEMQAFSPWEGATALA